MAIYHCSLRNFSRSEGHSAVAAAAYRAGAMLTDERTGVIHRYHKRTGVADTFILAPHNAPEKFTSRAFLWNAAEASENRKNSRVAREVILALPHELSDKARADLTRDMGLYLMERYRVAVDIAIHSPCEGDGHDPRNHHAHLLFTTREVTKDGFGAKTRILDDKVTGPQEIEIIREVWETLANDALKRAGFTDIQIDRRTLHDQGIDRIPQTHEGKAARNAQSLLAKDFKKADSGGEDESGESSGEEDGSGEKTSSSTSSSGGGSKALISKVREDDKGRLIDYLVIDKERTRLDFNAEIKALNERRALFDETPLPEQIKELERLTEKLERRQQRVQELLEKSTLPFAIKASVEASLKTLKNTLFAKNKPRKLFQLSADEKHARTERQRARYGLSYRTGLHERMQEMRTNLDTLETKQSEYKRFKSFIDKIETQIKETPKAVFTAVKSDKPTKIITPDELSRKLTLRADFIREHVPEKFKPERPQPKTEFKTNSAVEAVSSKDKAPIIVNKPPALEVKPEIKQAPREETKPQAPLQPQTPPTERKSWFIPASEKTKPLQQLIEHKLPELKAAEPQVKKDQPVKQVTAREVTEQIRQEVEVKRERIPPQYQPKQQTEPAKAIFKDLQREIEKRTEDKKGVSLRSKFNTENKEPEIKPEPKRASNESVIERTKETAEKLRASIPEQYRAKPYETPAKVPEATKPAENNVQSKFQAATENTPPDSPKPHPKMSEGFNVKSGFNQAAESKPDQSFGDEPEVEI